VFKSPSVVVVGAGWTTIAQVTVRFEEVDVHAELPNNGLNPTTVAVTAAADFRGVLAPAAGYAGRSAASLLSRGGTI
jgi:hypothetical protein